MNQYTVYVTRTSYQMKEIIVEADSREEAKEIALKEAPEHEFKDHSSEYGVVLISLDLADIH